MLPRPSPGVSTKKSSRVVVPSGSGFLPAFWMLSRNRPYGGDGRSGEIDVMEVDTAHPRDVLTTVHWIRAACGGGCNKESSVLTLPAAADATEWHTYRLDWAPESLVWTVDGKVAQALGDDHDRKWASAAPDPAPGSPTYPAPFDASNSMYLLLDLAVGGNLPGPPGASTEFPATMEVDWVRVFRKAA